DGSDPSWPRLLPPVGITNIAAISAGCDHSLLLKKDGTIASYGSNAYGQAAPPVGLSGVIALEAHCGYSVALKNDGTVVSWGNWYGNNDIPVGLGNVVAISAGDLHVVARKDDGSLVSWGSYQIPASGYNVQHSPTRTATATFTASRTRTNTNTRTNTPTRTNTRTATPTRSATNTRTATPTRSATNTRTSTITLTPSITQTASRTLTPSVTTVPASNIFTFTPEGLFGWQISNGSTDLGSVPTLTLYRNTTYRFSAQFSSAHTLYLSREWSNAPANLYSDVSGFPVTTGSYVDFTLPLNAPDTLWYICGVHPSMAGQINVLTPP
ncbi:MAG: hypothetical protein LW717_05765, partial [Chloroflexaceae bacterium]|nr:hypothetical protein [Chloroflexaceae bacterium]